MSKRQHTYFRDMKSVLFTEHRIAPSFKIFAKSRLLPLIKLDGYKLPQKKRIALHCLHNLAITQLRNKVVADNRDGSHNTLRIAVWDAIVDAGLCRVCIGNELTGHISRYRATGKLVKLLELYKRGQYIDSTLDFNTQRKQPTKDGLVLLHSGKTDLRTGKRLSKDRQKQLLSLSPLPSNILRYLAERETRHDECNRINGEHSWWVEAFEPEHSQLPYEPNYCLKETHSGSIGRYVRLVGWSNISIQQLSKRERRTILIDDEPATELDYGEFDIRRHYHYEGINPRGDAYRPELILPHWYSSSAATTKRRKIIRKFLKRCTNALLNVSSESQGKRAIGNLLHKQPERCKRLLWKIFLEYEDMDDRIPTQLTQRILSVHSDIRHVFCDDWYGPLMMSLGAGMMDEIRWKFAQKDKPCYTIHDAIICRQSDRSYAKRVMKKVYLKWVPRGFSPVINVEF